MTKNSTQGTSALTIQQPFTLQQSINLRPKYDFVINEGVDYSVVIEDLHRHDNIDAWIASAYKTSNSQKDYKQHFFRQKDLIVNKHNGYISPSTYIKAKRIQENLLTLNALWSDIDCYKTKFEKKVVIRELIFKIFTKKLPLPTYVLDTGNGLLALWIFDDPLILQKKNGYGLNQKALNLWKAAQQKIHSILKKYGADPDAIDPVHMVRPSNTMNEKGEPKPVKIELNYGKYITINDFVETWLPAFEEKYPSFDNADYYEPSNYTDYINFGDDEETTKEPKIQKIRNYERLHQLREADLLKLLEIRDYEVYGKRNIFLTLFITYNLSNNNGNIEKTLDDAIIINNQLKSKENLTNNDVKNKVDNCYRVYMKGKKPYCFSTRSIIDRLDISKEEQKKMKTLKLRSKAAKIAEFNEYRKTSRRNLEGKTTRQALQEKTLVRINELKEQGLNNTQIAQQLSYSVRHIRRIINSR